MSLIGQSLTKIDRLISDYEKKVLSLRDEFHIKDNEILEKDYAAYEEEEKRLLKDFHEASLAMENELESLCKTIRNQQPPLTDLEQSFLGKSNRMPEELVVGKLHVKYKGFENKMPLCVPFPLTKALVVDNESEQKLIHALLLRLLYALPLCKCNLTVYDPEELGYSVGDFLPLAGCKKLVPEAEFMRDERSLTEALQKLIDQTKNMIQTLFPRCSRTCRSWSDYNDSMCQRGEYGKILPYNIVLLYGLNPELSADIWRYLDILVKQGARCGILVILSYDKQDMALEDGYHSTNGAERIQSVLSQTINLNSLYGSLNLSQQYQNLRCWPENDVYPNEVQNLIYDLVEATENHQEIIIGFDDLVRVGQAESRYHYKSIEGLEIPIGTNVNTGELLKLHFSDQHVHTLIGGMTGTGKSNLLHNIICSSCWNYSPDELNVYLLDFKDGVEFSKYAKPELPHAQLIATEADEEYAAVVLQHLVAEKVRRNKLFEGKNLSSFIDYRKACPNDVLPRILVIIDEFQLLFDGKSAQANEEYLTMLSKQGRSVGIHLLLSTQTVKGIYNIRQSMTQFSSRIALKCQTTEDSNTILGGEYNNDEAAFIEKYHAIYNIGSGRKEANQEFMPPLAATNSVRKVAEVLNSDWSKEHIITTKIFDGQKLPALPPIDQFRIGSGWSMSLGEKLDYENSPLQIRFNKSEEENLAVLGNKEEFKQSLLQAMLLSAHLNKLVDEIIFVGSEAKNSGLQKYMQLKLKPVRVMEKAKDFIAEIKGNISGCKRLVIIDNCNFKKQLNGFGIGNNYKDEALALKEYFENKSLYRNYVIAFYKSQRDFNESGLDAKNFFSHYILIGINDDLKRTFLIPPRANVSGRAYYHQESGEGQWFRPYVANP